MAESDFPPLADLQSRLDLLPWQFKRASKKDLERIDNVFEHEFPSLVEFLPEVGSMKNTLLKVAPRKPPRTKKWKKPASLDLPIELATGTGELSMPSKAGQGDK